MEGQDALLKIYWKSPIQRIWSGARKGVDEKKTTQLTLKPMLSSLTFSALLSHFLFSGSDFRPKTLSLFLNFQAIAPAMLAVLRLFCAGKQFSWKPLKFYDFKGRTENFTRADSVALVLHTSVTYIFIYTSVVLFIYLFIYSLTFFLRPGDETKDRNSNFYIILRGFRYRRKFHTHETEIHPPWHFWDFRENRYEVISEEWIFIGRDVKISELKCG